jgi:hypothetical protein
MVPQDLHIHTVYSVGDSAIVKEQTTELIYNIRHAQVIGISDHFEYLLDSNIFETYEKELRRYGFYVGTEISGFSLVNEAIKTNCDYFVYHCSMEKDYKAVELLIDTKKPVIIAHPLILGTNLDRIPQDCYVEINNRYIWQSDWRKKLSLYVNRFRFVISSDAHQPGWLNQNVGRYVCRELGIRETLLFPDKTEKIILMRKSGLN